jgi:hypothetical protein
MEQGRVGEYPIEALIGQIELKEILLPHFKFLSPGYCSEFGRSIQTDSNMAKLRECLQISSRATTEIQDRERLWSLDILKESLDVLAHIVILRGFPELPRIVIVMPEGPAGDRL